MNIRTAGFAAAVLASTSLALAQTESKPASQVTPAPAGQPSAPPELEQIKFFIGSWTCTGTVNASDFGPAHKTRSTVKTHSDLDGFWYSGVVQELKTAENPHPVKGVFHMTYDGAKKQFALMWVDNFGGWSMEFSPGLQGDTLAWEGEANMMGTKIPSRDKFVKKGEDGLTHAYDFQMKGQWTTVGEETCKRAAAAAAPVKKP